MKANVQTIPIKVDEVKLVYQTKTPASQRAKVTSSEDACKALLNSREKGTIEHHESFRILPIYRANGALGIAVVSNGGISGTVLDVWQIFITSTKQPSIIQYFLPLCGTILLKCNLLLAQET